MTDYSVILIRYNLIIILFLIIFTDSLLQSGYEDENIMKIVKRNLLCREKEYLKTRPLSENLKSFIRRVKRENKYSKVKRNRGSIQDNMYVLRGGDIIPLKQLNVRDTGEYKDITQKGDNVLQGKFTVVPLIVPRENASTDDVQTTCIYDEENTTISTTATANISAIEKVTDEYDMVPVEATTKGELLGKVIKDIKELVTFEKKSRPQGEASLCNVTGDWDSFAGGMQIRVSFGFGIPSKSPKISLVTLEPPREGFLTDNNWNATGIAPFPNSSMISFTVVSTTTKKLAMFLGECRICEGAESITGFWMLRRRSKNCKDREEANAFFSDVLRKNNVRRLQHEHLDELVSTIVPLERK
ncbi:unnamed protein product [Psylliodes chrysocephalus]|uniref:Uncharacterized protein n=1 Tax=Psylliodes chrysocephalus TaxID=3402493 RepID=A0A9P0G5N9_9CUCU|nr:unnamed protein product [Psylliodes chrysocephala]